MSIEKEFVWNDELVKEFMDKYNNISGWITGIDPRGDKMKEFKQSKLSNDKGSERIKVIGFRSNDGYVPYEKQQQSWSYTLNLSKEVIGDYSEFRKKIEQALNVEDKVVRHVYNSMEFETNAGEKLFLCMRDSGYEIQYFGTTYEFKEGKCIPHIKSDKKYTQSEVDTIRKETVEECIKVIEDFYKDAPYPPTVYIKDRLTNLKHQSLSNKPEPVNKEQYSKEWEILTCFDNKKSEFKETDWHYYIPKGDNLYISNCEDDKCRIRSVRRTSDQTIFSIGDKVKTDNGSEGIIESFSIGYSNPRNEGKADIYVAAENLSFGQYLDAISKVKAPETLTQSSSTETKPVLFTTEDGVEIYGDENKECINSDNKWLILPFVDIEKWIIGGTDVLSHPPSKSDRFKIFSTKAAAEQYILENKPCLSLNDLKAALKEQSDGTYRGIENWTFPDNTMPENVYQSALQTAKQKLNL